MSHARSSVNTEKKEKILTTQRDNNNYFYYYKLKAMCVQYTYYIENCYFL